MLAQSHAASVSAGEFRVIPAAESPVTIVMYHYVRDLMRSRYPAIKGLDLAYFREQLAYILRHYTVITAEQLMAAVKDRADGRQWDLPRNSCMLTFDDGYTDHFRSVFPLLDEARVQGSFFPPATAAIDRRVLDVNKIHFVVAAAPDIQRVIVDLFAALDKHRDAYELPSNEALYFHHAQASRYETADAMFFKRLLQTVLPTPLRTEIASELFARYVTADEQAFATELYAGVDELRCMSRNGMYIGSHADTHPWLGHLSPAQQVAEIDRSMELLREIGTPLDSWIMCYPYGSSNASLHEILRARGCCIGLTTRVGVSCADDDPLELSRIDTNDLPRQANASANSWTARVTSANAG